MSTSAIGRLGWWGIAMCALAITASAADAQQRVPGVGRFEVFVNSEVENYLRVLQASGQTELYPWSARSFSLAEVDRLRPQGAHPWSARYDLAAPDTSRVEWGWVRPTTRMIFNSAFPHGFNDGPVWAGRGATVAYQMGAAFRYGPLSITLAPQLFWAQNAEFELAPNGQAGRLAFADIRYFSDEATPFRIDLPQRFGDGPYTRLDPGQSSVRLDLSWVAAGISTANQHWGPAVDQPIILGNNAPGFLHGFVGSRAPVNIWIGRIHGRAVWGRLEHTEFAPIEFAVEPIRGEARLSSGLILVFSPRFLPGLEVGIARFFHDDWPVGGPNLRALAKPFESFLKAGLPDGELGGDGTNIDNQIASAFFRWVFPGSGVDVYGEFGRYDHSWDLRDFLLEPDHDSGYLLGLQKSWRPAESTVVAARGEILNTSIGHLHQVRTPQVPFYVHGWLPQGHTHRGQILGAAAGYGGGASVLAVDVYRPSGRVSAAWRRELRQEAGNFWWDHTPERLAPNAVDVKHSLGAEALVFRGRWEITAGLTGVYNLNRDYLDDVFNVNATLQVRAGF